MEGQEESHKKEESHNSSICNNDNKPAKDKKGCNDRATRTILKHRVTGSADDMTGTGTQKGSRSAGQMAQVAAMPSNIHMQLLGLSPVQRAPCNALPTTIAGHCSQCVW
jgi:hypothetical protein